METIPDSRYHQMGSVRGNTDTTHLPLEETPVMEHVKRVIRWVIGLGALGTVMILYYLMTVDVEADKVTQEVEAKKEALRVLKRDQAFVSAQVGRLVFAITNSAQWFNQQEMERADALSQQQTELCQELTALRNQLTELQTFISTNHYEMDTQQE